ncbi:conserved hypothetical protein [Shewanella violacea DSS12]|uniref:ABM domain-containing protein n=2 Tax=Shewanella violacea TaxID=60217 RepID=D4ZC70_SHEVD|nr:conserved hypothetical protein [Shewanella violacea DSS12]
MTTGTNMINVLTRFKAQSGKEKALLELLKSLVQPTRNELGCVKYELHQENEKQGHFIFIKSFVDHAAFEKHQNTGHFKRLKKEMPELIAQEPEIIILSRHA